jgi:hypothetical protein
MLKQLFFILVGFFIGQGSFFALQSYLLFEKKFELLTNLGLGVGLLSLFQWLSDSGGTVHITKMLDNLNYKVKFSSFVVARILNYFLFFLLLLVIQKLFSILNPFVWTIVLYSSVSSIAWAFNISAVADYYGKNKIVGPVSGLNFLFVSLVCLICYDSPNLANYVGVSFCAGVITTVILQYAICEYKFELFSVSFVDVRNLSSSSFAFNSCFFGSQAYARILVVIIENALGVYFSGVYVYIKSFTNCITQLIAFTRRLEYKNLSGISEGHNFKSVLIQGFCRQLFSLISIVLSFVAVVVVYGYFKVFIKDYEYDFYLEMCLIFTSVLVPWVIASGMAQILLVKNHIWSYALYNLFSIILSILLTLKLLSHDFELYAVAISESIMYLVQIFMYSFVLTRLNSKRLLS